MTSMQSIVTGLLFIFASAIVQAGSIEVNVSNDPGDGSTPGTLSWALDQANNDPGQATITLSTDVLLIGPMQVMIDSDVAIQSDATRRSIDGNESHRPLFIRSGTVSLESLNLVNGRARGGTSTGSGGGAGMGGAIFILDGRVTIHDVNFINNLAYGGRGGATGVGAGAGMHGNAFGDAGAGLHEDSSGIVGDGAGDNGGQSNVLDDGGNGGFGGGGGWSIFADGGSGGFGAGGGNGKNGGHGGFGAGGGASRSGFSAAGSQVGGNGGFGGGGGYGPFGSGQGGWAGGTALRGGDGAGLGGAIFVHAGTLDLFDSSFNDNKATPGGNTALAHGGDLFICTADLHATAASCNGTARANDATEIPDVFGDLGSNEDPLFQDRFEQIALNF